MMMHKPKHSKKPFLMYSVWLVCTASIVAQQRVGIGTTLPVSTLHLLGPGNNPAIPGAASTGIFRIGISTIEAMDAGKMQESPFAGWLQCGYDGFVPDPLSLQPVGGNVGIGTTNPVNKLSVTGNANITGNVGIGTTTPGSKLHIQGSVRIVDGMQGDGKILTSDADGLASWQPPPPAPATYFPAVTICCQSWMTKDLNVSTYRNGDPIPHVTDNTEWSTLTTGAYCYYNNDSTTYAAVYGKLYNWYAVNDSRGLAPEGWHVPTVFEFGTLLECLGGYGEAGGQLKEEGTVHWDAPNTGGSNITGFNGLPGGYRSQTGEFNFEGSSGHYWMNRKYDSNDAWIRFLQYNTASVIAGSVSMKRGNSVRCISD